MDSDQIAEVRLKLILIGSAGVGKTSLVSSYFDHPFEEHVLSTVAPAFSPAIVQLGPTKVALQIWDTAGQERYQSISQMFYRDAQIAFICFDHKNFDTVDKWVGQLHANVTDACVIFLVATKADLLAQREFEEFRQQMRAKATEIGAERFLSTSAKTSMGVKEVFLEAAKCHAKANAVAQPEHELAPASGRSACCGQ
jgi:small GTP-binding protein